MGHVVGARVCTPDTMTTTQDGDADCDSLNRSLHQMFQEVFFLFYEIPGRMVTRHQQQLLDVVSKGTVSLLTL